MTKTRGLFLPILHEAVQFYRKQMFPNTSLRNKGLTKSSHDWLVNF